MGSESCTPDGAGVELSSRQCGQAYGRGAEVSTSSSATRRHFWRSDWFVGACIVVAVVVLWRFDAFEPLESRFYDIASTRSSRQPSDPS